MTTSSSSLFAHAQLAKGLTGDIDDALALLSAASTGETACVKRLVERIIANKSREHMALLVRAAEIAAQNGHAECLCALIMSLGDSALLSNLAHAFEYAVKQGHIECLSVLLDCGFNVTDKGQSALAVAAGHGHRECLQLLLTRGICAQRDYALWEANRAGFKECVSILLECGANPSVIF